MSVPCYRCFFVEEVKARGCNPVECQTLNDYLNEDHLERVPTPQPAQLFTLVQTVPRGRAKRKWRPDIIQDAKQLAEDPQVKHTLREISEIMTKKYHFPICYGTVKQWLNE